MKPGSVEALNALPVGTILCHLPNEHVPPNDLFSTWRKRADGAWEFWADGLPRGSFVSVHDETDLKLLSGWEIHPASPYVITEDDELDEEMAR